MNRAFAGKGNRFQLRLFGRETSFETCIQVTSGEKSADEGEIARVIVREIKGGIPVSGRYGRNS